LAELITARYLVAPGGKVTTGNALVFEGPRILEVGPVESCARRYPGAERRNLGDSALSAGFVNAHMHLYGVLAHGLVPPVKVSSFEGFLGDYWWPLVENLLDARMVAAATRASALELADSGVTSLCDILEAPLAGVEALEAEAAVLRELGIRAVLSSEACERISPEAGRNTLDEGVAFARSLAGDALISAALCTHTSFTCSETFMKYAAGLAASTGVDLQLHLSESRYEPEWSLAHRGERPAEWYDRIGILGRNLLAAQCVQVSGGEIELLASRGVRAAHLPLSNCEVGGGIAPMPEMLRAGMACGLGTDGYVNDFFEVMRGAFLIHKGHREDPAVMDAATVWKMATEGGADAVFPGRGLGRLEAGAQADFIAIDLSDLPSPSTEENLLDQLILFRKGSHVRESRVAGRCVKRDGSLATGNLAEARAASRAEAARLWESGREIARRAAAGSVEGGR
jgi:cytosine/adenosine deaminase-related metal-dependent hydrolase